jgi:hypothetical protein
MTKYKYVWFFLLGIFNAICSVCATAAGDGTNLLMYVYTAPISLIGSGDSRVSLLSCALSPIIIVVFVGLRKRFGERVFCIMYGLVVASQFYASLDALVCGNSQIYFNDHMMESDSLIAMFCFSIPFILLHFVFMNSCLLTKKSNVAPVDKMNPQANHSQ